MLVLLPTRLSGVPCGPHVATPSRGPLTLHQPTLPRSALAGARRMVARNLIRLRRLWRVLADAWAYRLRHGPLNPP